MHDKKAIPSMGSKDRLGDNEKREMKNDAKEVHNEAEPGPDMSQAPPPVEVHNLPHEL